jgi:hypothetical protein
MYLLHKTFVRLKLGLLALFFDDARSATISFKRHHVQGVGRMSKIVILAGRAMQGQSRRKVH